MDFTRLTESDEYRRQREELRLAELDLVDHVERVAALRRQLSADTVVDDYLFIDVASGAMVPLSALFTRPDRALILYHFMYGKAQTEPCPLCTMWIDGYNAAAPHLTQNADFAVVAAAEPAAIVRSAEGRLSVGRATRLIGLPAEARSPIGRTNADTAKMTPRIRNRLVVVVTGAAGGSAR
jgi:predicted dithiol-disulfide oxidoreductase (DUF899 family)